MIFEQYSLIPRRLKQCNIGHETMVMTSTYTVSFIKLEISWRIIFSSNDFKDAEACSYILQHRINRIEIVWSPARVLKYAWRFYFRNDKNRNRQLFPLWDDVYLAISMNSNDASNFYYCADSLTNQSAASVQYSRIFHDEGQFSVPLLCSPARVHRLSESRVA